MTKTAEQLQQEGKERRERGDFVPYIYPRQVESFTEAQIPHIVVNMNLK